MNNKHYTEKKSKKSSVNKNDVAIDKL